MLKKFFTILVLVANLFSENNIIYKEDCNIPNDILKTILLTENEKKYPYYIRFNSENDEKEFNNITSHFEHKKISRFLIDCKNKENCQDITYYLTVNGIQNIDLGFYQINYRFFPEQTEIFFDKDKSYYKACEIIEEKIKGRKWDWTSLASYHSRTPSLNKIYAKKLKTNYKLVLQKKDSQ